MSDQEDSEVGNAKRIILLVDDEKSIRDSLRLILQNNFEVHTAESGDEALELLQHQQPDIILLDVMMPKVSGIETLRRLHSTGLDIPVIMLTADSTVETAVEAMKLGAVDYLMKPFDVEALTSLIVATLKLDPSSQVVKKPSQSVVQENLESSHIVGSSVPMQAVFDSISKVAIRDTTVLITGESGTGKELFARKIHESSDRCHEPFVALNCGAIPETLIESELFGHEKGAFTSAIDSRVGYCELANGGTLFLDEIGELGLSMQVKLLRFLQEREFHRIGSSSPISVDVRVIAATNQNLEELINTNQFRNDLYYRINVVNIALPPLRDRFEDVPDLIDHFQAKYSPVYEGRKLNFDQESLQLFKEYHWPGNIRELENVIESLLALCPSAEVSAEDLPPKMKEVRTLCENELQIFKGSLNFHEAEKAFETEIIVKALRKTNFVQTRAAELLGISRRILRYKMDKLGITEDGRSQQLLESSNDMPSELSNSD